MASSSPTPTGGGVSQSDLTNLLSALQNGTVAINNLTKALKAVSTFTSSNSVYTIRLTTLSSG